MQTYIEAHYNSDNGSAVADRAASLEAYMALSGKLLADAKYHYNTAMNSDFINAIKTVSNLTASIQKKYVDSICKDYQYLVDWCGRINAACTHQLDMCRSVMSTLREEMKQLNYTQK
ncbi:MAG TPA: hypothetical protein PL085_11710 [Agriterribacter sp.]|uniref:hypothetical protein n=1 Tax=Agriterribacter sp. TaxID=2821509 RepID=UPI002C9DBCB9|nr:hypothetical protein [Agriterribacter sp.]HRQ17735.1 hypothetical protein [Agriterribacter sp.]